MTLPAQSIPASEPDEAAPASARHTPAALLAVVGVSALVVILCVIGATFSGLFSFLSNTEPAQDPGPSLVLTSDAPPVTTFGDGQYLVKNDVLAGTYETTVPADSPSCAWERRSATDGTANSLLARGSGTPGESLVVIIEDTDKIFYTRGCGTWNRTSDES